MRALVLAMLVACKADSSPPPVEASGSASPHAPSSSPDLAIGSLMPLVDGAKVLQSKSPAPTHAIATWCIDDQDPIARIKAALARDGWSDVRTRGNLAGRGGIAATRGDARFSAITGAADARCAGTVVTATVMRLGKVTLPALEGDDRIR